MRREYKIKHCYFSALGSILGTLVMGALLSGCLAGVTVFNGGEAETGEITAISEAPFRCADPLQSAGSAANLDLTADLTVPTLYTLTLTSSSGVTVPTEMITAALNIQATLTLIPGISFQVIEVDRRENGNALEIDFSIIAFFGVVTTGPDQNFTIGPTAPTLNPTTDAIQIPASPLPVSGEMQFDVLCSDSGGRLRPHSSTTYDDLLKHPANTGSEIVISAS